MTAKVNDTVRIICRVLKVSRSAYYAWVASPRLMRSDDICDTVHIKAIFRPSRGAYGVPRVTEALRRAGRHLNHKKVARLMKHEGLKGTPVRRFRGITTDSNHLQVVPVNVLNRNFSVSAPNEAWVGDITYIRVGVGFGLPRSCYRPLQP